MSFVAKDVIRRNGGDLDMQILENLQNAVGAVTFDRSVKVDKVALAAVDTGGGVFSWQNPEDAAIIVERVVIDVTTASTGACTIDVGVTATSATTVVDNLLDGQSVAAVATLDNIENQGTNGKSVGRLASGKWVTASVASGASAGLVGSAYIHYILA